MDFKVTSTQRGIYNHKYIYLCTEAYKLQLLLVKARYLQTAFHGYF